MAGGASRYDGDKADTEAHTASGGKGYAVIDSGKSDPEGADKGSFPGSKNRNRRREWL